MYFGSEKELRKLKRKVASLETKVKELEVKVEQSKKETNDSLATQIARWLLVILEIAVAVVALVKSILG